MPRGSPKPRFVFLAVLAVAGYWQLSHRTSEDLVTWTGNGLPVGSPRGSRGLGKVSRAATDGEKDKLKAMALQLADKKPRLAPIPMPYGNVSLDLSMMGYNQFVPRLYHFCISLGMEKGHILPSIGFCSDENQGYPTILITKHFGAYPFNHGYIGGIMALDRHGPHAAHGDDVVIIHAPHVGFDPDAQRYGMYRRRQNGDEAVQMSTCCGKVAGVVEPYVKEYEKLLARIRVREEEGTVLISLSNTLWKREGEGIALNMATLLEPNGLSNPVVLQSTSAVYRASKEFSEKYKAIKAEIEETEKPESDKEELSLPGVSKRLLWRSLKEPGLSKLLTKDMFYFVKGELPGERNRMERVLLPNMPAILTSPYDPELSASMIVMQSEFDRSVHSIAAEPSYKNKNLLLISGLNVDISPASDLTEAFPQTMFLPWAAYVQLKDGRRRVLEQSSLVEELFAQMTENDDAINIEESIRELFLRKRNRITFFDTKTSKKKAAQVL